MTDKLVKERWTLSKKMGRAVAKGTVACVEYPEGCVRSFWKYFPSSSPGSEAERTQAIAKNVALLQARLKNMTYFREGAPQQWGSFTDADWKTNIQALKIGGQIETTEISPASLYTNQFVEKFNQFDRAALIERAKRY